MDSFFFYSIVMLNAFVRCGDHAPFLNLFNVTLKSLSMFKVDLFCHLHPFFACCFYPFVELFVLKKQKRNKFPTAQLPTFFSLFECSQKSVWNLANCSKIFDIFKT